MNMFGFRAREKEYKLETRIFGGAYRALLDK
jgi:hypothetical protein